MGQLEVVEYFVHSGRRVQSLVQSAAQPGRFTATWNLATGDGVRVTPGSTSSAFGLPAGSRAERLW